MEAKEATAQSNRNSGCADKIYEQMSPELFRHYMEVKKTYVPSSADGGEFQQVNGGMDDDNDDEDDAYEDMNETGSTKTGLDGIEPSSYYVLV